MLDSIIHWFNVREREGKKLMIQVKTLEIVCVECNCNGAFYVNLLKLTFLVGCPCCIVDLN